MTGIWLALTLFVGCGSSTDAPKAEECDLSVANLEGKSFLMHEALPDKTYKDNPIARVKFVKGESGLDAQYTAMSVSDVYTYHCQAPKGEGEEAEVYCAEQERVVDWCQALEVVEAGSCNRKALRKLGATQATDDELKASIKKARKTVAEYRDTPNWPRFKMNNNNLGNKLQGRIYLKADTKRCRLSLSDMYFTIYDGKGVEDTNPVGINPFVETKDQYMFEHCDEGRNIVADLNEADPPADPATIKPEEHKYGAPVYYYYYGEKDAKAEEGCKYSADTYASWRPVDKGLEITPEASGQLLWRGSHTWTSDNVADVQGKKASLFEMVRYKQCGDAPKQKINTVCNVYIN